MKNAILLVTVVVSLAGASASGAADGLPKALPTPTLKPFVPAGELSWYDGFRQVINEPRHWVFWREGGLLQFNTSESVGDGSAMKLVLPAGEKTSGWLVGYDTGAMPVKVKDKVVSDRFKDYQGICLWIKGDGSDASAVFTTGYGVGKRPQFRVPLKDKQWKKVFLPWREWTPPIDGNFWFLTYGLERKDAATPASFIVDRVHLYKERKVETISPTPNVDPPGNLPARPFTTGREHVAKTLAKLKARKPVKIVVAGDSIVVAAQMGYIRTSYKRPASDAYPYTFWGVLSERLKKAYGYESAGIACRTFGKKDKDGKPQWYDVTVPRPKSDLQVVAVAVGGWEARLGLQHVDQILSEKPDLVIWEYGANEAINGHLDDYAAGKIRGYVSSTTEAIEKLRAAGIEVVLQTVTTTADLYPKGWLKGKTHGEYAAMMNEHTRRIAREKGCALADVHGAMAARGLQFVGALHGDFVHLNHYGHALWADVLEALLTDGDVRTWKHVPPAGL